MAEAVASGKRNKKKFVRRKAPTRGYKHWDEETFQRLIERPPESLESQFSLDHGLLIGLLRGADELIDGARPLIDREGRSDLEVVIEEIVQDKITIDWEASGLEEPKPARR